jgi:hypothetical protein
MFNFASFPLKIRLRAQKTKGFNGKSFLLQPENKKAKNEMSFYPCSGGRETHASRSLTEPREQKPVGNRHQLFRPNLTLWEWVWQHT